MKRKDLLDAINKVKPALADGKLIEFKGLLLFDGEKLVSYGDEISVSVPLKTDFIGAVKEDEFKKLIQKTTNPEIKISSDGKQFLVESMESGEMKAGFSLIEYNSESIPDLGLAQVKRWFSFPEGFIEVLKFCIFSASTNDAYGVLCNLNIGTERIVSGDNYRITERSLSKKMFGLKGPLLIPRKVASFLSGFKLTKYALTENCVHYKDDTEVVFTHRFISEEYPSINEYLEIQGEELNLPKELAGILSRAQTIIPKDEDKVTIVVSEGKIKVKAEGTGTWFEEPTATDYKGKDLQFDASPEHLIQILNYSTETIIGENALLFKGKDFRHSVCLISEE